MLDRRAFTGIVLAAAISNPSLSAEEGLGGKLKSGIDWFIEIVKEAPRALENIYDWLLRAKAGDRILFDSRAALNDIRRRLADPSTEEGLRSKLRTWLKHYDQIANEKAKPAELRPDFVARQRRELDELKAEWDALKKDSVEALHQIGRLQDQIESIDPGALNSEEDRLFRSLLAQKKEEEEFLNIEAPTDPYVIKRLHDTADQLDKTIRDIGENAPALDAAIKKAG